MLWFLQAIGHKNELLRIGVSLDAFLRLVGLSGSELGPDST